MNRLPRAVLFVSVLVATTAGAQTKITQADLLARIVDLDRLTAPPPPDEQSGLFSSFDRASKTVKDGKYASWDANNDRGQFVRKSPDGWDVMAELEGAGVVTRVWCEEPAGDLQIIVDGQIVAEGKLADLFTGGIDPFGEPLCYMLPRQTLAPASQASQPRTSRCGMCYFPIGFAKSLHVQTRGFAGAYQVDYVTWEPGTQVQPFHPDLDGDALKQVERTSQILRSGYTERLLLAKRKTMTFARNKELKAGEKLDESLEGHGTVRALYVAFTQQFEPSDPYYWRDVVLRIYWDGAATPDVEAPLCDFFGSGFDRHANSGLACGTAIALENPAQFENQGLWFYSYWPMPYQKGMRLTIENRNKRRIGIALYARIETTPPASDALRFRARFAFEKDNRKFDVPLLKAEGAGRLVGTVLSVDCPRKEWWGEGDHKIWIDGEAFPSHFGCDTNGCFGLPREPSADSLKLHGASVAALQGKSSYYRWRLADAVAFHRSLRLTVEDWQPARSQDMYYSSAAFWYGEPGAKDVFGQAATETLRPPGLRIAGAQEVETSIRSQNWGNVVDQRYAGGGVEFSGDKAASISSTAPVSMTIVAAKAGSYRLMLRTHPRRSFDPILVKTAAGRTIGEVKWKRTPDGVHEVGRLDAAAGENEITVMTARNAVLDYWLLQPIEN